MFKNKHILQIVVIALVIGSFSLGIKMGQSDALNGQDRLTFITLERTLVDIIKTTEENYYKEVDRNEMMKGAIRGAMAALNDPYSFYMEPRKLKRERENLYRGEFGGLGIRIYEDKNHFVKIARPLPNTPAMRAGLQAGDIIAKIEGESIILDTAAGMTLDDVVDKLRGEKGTSVNITIYRSATMETFDVDIVRDTIKINSVETEMLDSGIGYIKIQEHFTGRTYKEFADALKSLNQDNKLKALILDLRDNPGGLLEAAWNVSNAFLSEGVIVSTRGREHKYDKVYHATESILMPAEIPLVVMVNGYSASGSEIVAGAVKDSKRGILVGSKTYGKGLVQQRMELKRGPGAISLTISSYYTPNGTSIHETGITPNIEADEWHPSAIDQLMLRKAREKELIENFVMDYIKQKTDETGAQPKDFAELKARLGELTPVLEDNGIKFEEEKVVMLEARRIFDPNVGIARLIDLENDVQLQRAIEVIKSGEIAKILAQATPE
ncbi:TPA: S41 family peptidase [Candidatus Poribacteria bacterium]|nr:S41 family peptidase [Candidatus Poribacteria bacterium]